MCAMDKEHIFAQTVTALAALLFLGAVWTAPTNTLNEELSLTAILILLWAFVGFYLYRLRDKT